MPLSLTVSCSSKIQIGCTFLVPAYPGCPGKEAVKRLYRLTRVVPDKGPLKRVCVNFVAVILKVLLVNLLAAVNFANVFLNKKRLENKKKR